MSLPASVWLAVYGCTCFGDTVDSCALSTVEILRQQAL